MPSKEWSSKSTFFETVDMAVADIMKYGFDTIERLQLWQERIIFAASRMLTPQRVMEKHLREALTLIYQKMVEKKGLFKYHPGVDVFTINKVAPQLHNELAKRIAANADLIKNNRAQAILKCNQRLAGWASSVPAGGSKTQDKPDTEKDIKKSLKQLPFEERRVIIDQGHKLVASINDVVAKGGGAIACQWHSHWKQPGYDYREDHKERDDHIYLLRGSWADQAGYVKASKDGYYDKITQAAEEPFCRCYVTYFYNLRDLPISMLSPKGIAELDRVRKQIAEMMA